jgi:hypothetical protein
MSKSVSPRAGKLLAESEPELRAAFLAYEGLERAANTKVGCVMVMILMPLGAPMDYYVYPDKFWLFLGLRFASALIAGLIWLLLGTNLGKRYSQLLGNIIPMVPVFFIAWMIASARLIMPG